MQGMLYVFFMPVEIMAYPDLTYLPDYLPDLLHASGTSQSTVSVQQCMQILFDDGLICVVHKSTPLTCRL